MSLSVLRNRLVQRALAFLLAALVYSGVLGVLITYGNFFPQYGFIVYGGLGKAALFAAAAFVILTWRDIFKVKMLPFARAQLLWAGASLAAFGASYLLYSQMEQGPNALLATGLHAALWGSLAAAALATFGYKNIKNLAQAFGRQIVLTLGLAAGFSVFLFLAYGSWQYLSTIVMYAVQGLLNLSGIDTAIALPHTLLLDKFGITIAQYCSGIESIALFTGLYVIVGLLDWQKFNKRRYLLILPAALLVLFAFNILRVYALILAGYHINQQIAFSLFHTYAGMIFFIIYSALFWAVSYRWMLRRG